jgi:hypothetical protein
LLEDKPLCPMCGCALHRRPFLMSVDPDADWRLQLRRLLPLIVFLVALTAFQVTQ